MWVLERGFGFDIGGGGANEKGGLRSGRCWAKTLAMSIDKKEERERELGASASQKARLFGTGNRRKALTRRTDFKGQ